ncbi:MAG: hypothetical protein A2Y12_10290 [Planctomycetes bacterium GWF2_42_9]|nr:MAG: hypothetical protein A2Y12_10290 [Planctomycetes bacterium GWF2_42_9]
MSTNSSVHLLLVVLLVAIMPNILLATTVYDFVTNAPSATWANSKASITWGNSVTSDGAAYYTSTQLEDGTNLTNMLFNHPDYRGDVTNNHYVKGTYTNITIPDNPGMVKFSATVGFASGASGTDGTTFSISIYKNNKYYQLAAVDVKYDGLLNTLSADLTAYKGQMLTFILQVDAYANPNADWATWKEAKIVTCGTTIYDLIANAPSVTWQNSKAVVTWGNPVTQDGAAYYADSVQLENGTTYARTLFTHPDYRSDVTTGNHYMAGIFYNVTVPNTYDAVKFIARLGFANGAQGTDGVGAELYVVSGGVGASIYYTTATYDGKLDFMSADLSAYKGQTIEIHLVAYALTTTANDWACWTEAQIVGYTPETVYDFVANAGKASYSTGAGAIPWGNANANGHCYINTSSLLEDSQSYTYLFTHPDYGAASSHFINATFTNVIVPNNVADVQFTAKVGFASGASGTDGVTFNVYVIRDAQYTLLCTKTKTYDGTLATITGNLSGYQGQNITIMLAVSPGATVTNDWASWATAKITAKLPMQLHVSDWGAVANDGTDDLAAMNTIANKAKVMQPAEIYFDDGTYNLSNVWSITGLHNINIKGYSHDTPTNIINSNPAAGTFLLYGCRNINTRNFVIDYNPLPFTQGTISNLSGNTFTLTLDSGYPQLDEARFTSDLSKCLGIYKDPSASVVGRITAGSDGYTGITAAPVKLSTGVYRVSVSGVTGVANGQKFTYHAVGGQACGTCYEPNSHIVWDNVFLYSSPFMGFVATDIEKLFVRNCNVIIKPGTNRLQSANADGVHTVDCKNGPDVISSTFEAQGDDGVNVAGSGGRILAQTSSTRLSIYTYGRTYSIGERLVLFTPSTGTLGYASGVTVTVRHTPVTINGYLCEDVEFSSTPAATITVGWDNDKMFSIDWTGNNYLIKDCVFKNSRGRGVLGNGFYGVITDNIFNGLSDNAIRVANGSYWDEGLVSKGIAIKNNTITDCSLSAGNVAWYYSGQIFVAALKGNTEDPSTSIIQGSISITNNTITNWPRNAIYVCSSDSVTISGNTMTNYYPSSGPKSSNSWRGIMFFDNCTNVAVTSNTVVDQRPASGTYLINGVLFRKGFTGNLIDSGNSFTDNYAGSNIRDVTSY